MSTPDRIAGGIVCLLGHAFVLVEIDTCITVLIVTTICICLANTDPFESFDVAALTFRAGIIDITGLAGCHRMWCVASTELAVSTLALVSAAGHVARCVVLLERHATIRGQIHTGVAIVALWTLRVLSAPRQTTGDVIFAVLEGEDLPREVGEARIALFLEVIVF
jgi:hypothetical protein